MKKEDMAAAGKRKLEEYRLKKLEKASKVGNSSPAGSGALAQETGDGPTLERLRHLEVAALEAERASLGATVAELQTSNEHWHATLAQEQQEKAALQAELAKWQRQHGEVFERLRQMESQFVKADEQASALKRTWESVVVERNASLAAKEELTTQLRVLKRQLNEAHEEQYKAEEDAAALRAEVERLEQAAHSKTLRSPRESTSSEDARFSETEKDKAQAELQMALVELQGEQQKVVAERQRGAALLAEKEVLVQQLATTRQTLERVQEQLQDAERRQRSSAAEAQQALKVAASAAPSGELKAELERLKAEKLRVESSNRELAKAVERLESSRQKLLAEVDAQSLEIERLFGEKAGLESGLIQTADIAARWEGQVKELLGQNTELRGSLRQLREEAARAVAQPAAEVQAVVSKEEAAGAAVEPELQVLRAEKAQLQQRLSQAMERAEALAGQCQQVSADYNHVSQALSGLTRSYQPVLASIENRLLAMRQAPDLTEKGRVSGLHLGSRLNASGCK